MRRAEAIIDELTVTLDHERGGEVASNLQGIYAFCRRHLIEATAEQDPAKIEEVSELLGELREAWAEIAGVMTLRGPLGRTGRARRARARPDASTAAGKSSPRPRRSAWTPPRRSAPPGRRAAASRTPRRARSVRSMPACPRAAPSRSRSSAA